LSAVEVVRTAGLGEKVRAERGRHDRFAPTAYTRGPGRWQVSYFDSENREVAQVRIDDATGAILEEWTGDQVAWTMARGYEGAFGRKLNSPWIWLPLCVLFLAPFFDPRRPFRLLHLDLLMLLAFGASHVFFNRGSIDLSVPLVYPVLLYLLARMLWVGFRPRETGERLLPIVPATWLLVVLVGLVGFRVGLNVIDSNVIDVGYAGVIGADRIADGDPLYGPGFSEDVESGDTYGPLTYLSYVPFEQAMPWSGAWDDLPAAHGASIAFDLITLLGLVILGRRLMPGKEGYELGIALGYAWASYPYALFALQTNSNDGLVAMCTVLALLALTLAPAREGVSALGRGLAVGLGAAAKFAPLALAPLFAGGMGPWSERRRRSLMLFGVALLAVLTAAVLPFVGDGGLGGLYDRTVGYQASRPSPFSVWGQSDSLGWMQTALKAAAVGLALIVAVVPRRRGPVQVAALGAAVIIGVQLGVTHWFYLYVAWFAPFALVALLGSCSNSARRAPPAAVELSSELEPVPV
ncbi:MAG: hypothetical protein M3356_00450, partial [Actinomycetota bacterium]|nr:hypothetical protein [Actinomycetota bacterium]